MAERSITPGQKQQDSHGTIKAWVSIITAIITVLGSLGGAYITSRTTAKSEFSEYMKNMGTIHFESGECALHADTLNNFALSRLSKYVKLTDSPRLSIKHIEFDRKFTFVPVVFASLRYLDIGKEANARISVSVENATTSGFDLRFQTWADSRVHCVVANWIAYQQARPNN